MTHVICRLAAKNRDQLQNPTLGNRVWATFTFFNLRTKKPFKTRKILKHKKTFKNLKPENLFLKTTFFPDTVGIWCGSVTTLSRLYAFYCKSGVLHLPEDPSVVEFYAGEIPAQKVTQSTQSHCAGADRYIQQFRRRRDKTAHYPQTFRRRKPFRLTNPDATRARANRCGVLN